MVFYLRGPRLRYGIWCLGKTAFSGEYTGVVITLDGRRKKSKKEQASLVKSFNKFMNCIDFG